MISDLCKEQYCHCLGLQETHRGVITSAPHIWERYFHVKMITSKLHDVVAHSVYRTPTEQFVLPPLGHRILPKIVIGVSNSHNTIWGYDDTYNNGVAVVQWAESNSLTLIHNVKLLKSFNSARWRKGYNPDPIFASFRIDNMCVKSVLNPIPGTQHRPICVTVNPVLVSRPTAFRRRFNPRMANWSAYATDIDILIDEVDPTPENYDMFVETIRVTSRKHIPMECRRYYTSGLSEE